MLCIEAIPPTGKPVGFLARLFMTDILKQSGLARWARVYTAWRRFESGRLFLWKLNSPAFSFPEVIRPFFFDRGRTVQYGRKIQVRLFLFRLLQKPGRISVRFVRTVKKTVGNGFIFAVKWT